MSLKIKVTKINNRWHSRLFESGIIIDEMACVYSQDIGWICREMLRWYSKNGGVSKFAEHARKRCHGSHIGKIWYNNQLKIKKL